MANVQDDIGEHRGAAAVWKRGGADLRDNAALGKHHRRRGALGAAEINANRALSWRGHVEKGDWLAMGFGEFN